MTATTLDDLRLGKIFGGCDAFGGIGNVPTRSRHGGALLDNAPLLGSGREIYSKPRLVSSPKPDFCATVSLFRNSRGNAWTSDALNCSCNRYRKRLGFQVFPYIFRHTFATDAIVRGVDLMTIATLMGHKDLTMLTRIYQHLNLKCDHLKDAMRQITDAEDSDAA